MIFPPPTPAGPPLPPPADPLPPATAPPSFGFCCPGTALLGTCPCCPLAPTPTLPPPPPSTATPTGFGNGGMGGRLYSITSAVSGPYSWRSRNTFWVRTTVCGSGRGEARYGSHGGSKAGYAAAVGAGVGVVAVAGVGAGDGAVLGAAAGVLPPAAAAVFITLVPALIVALLLAFPAAAAAAAAAFFFPTTAGPAAAAAAGLIPDSDDTDFCSFFVSCSVADLAVAASSTAVPLDLSADLPAAAGAAPGFLDGDGGDDEEAAGFFSSDDDGRLSLGGEDCACDCLVRGPPPLRFLGAGPLAVLAGEGVFLLAALLLPRGLAAAGGGGEGVFLPLLLLRGLLRGDGLDWVSTSIMSSLSLLVAAAFASRLAAAAAAAEALRLRGPAIVPCQLSAQDVLETGWK